MRRDRIFAGFFVLGIALFHGGVGCGIDVSVVGGDCSPGYIQCERTCKPLADACKVCGIGCDTTSTRRDEPNSGEAGMSGSGGDSGNGNDSGGGSDGGNNSDGGGNNGDGGGNSDGGNKGDGGENGDACTDCN